MEITVNNLVFKIHLFDGSPNRSSIQREGFTICSFFFDEIISERITNDDYRVRNLSYLGSNKLHQVKSEMKKHLVDYKSAIDKYQKYSVFK